MKLSGGFDSSHLQANLQFVQIFLKDCPTSFIPSCHNIGYKLIKTFVTARIHFSLKKETNNNIKNTKNSRSVAMKAHVSNNHK